MCNVKKYYFKLYYRIGRILAPPIFSKKRGEGAKLSHKILSNLIKENNQSITVFFKKI